MTKFVMTILKYATSVVIAIGLLIWGFVSIRLFSEIFGKTKVLASEIGKRAEYAKFGDIYDNFLYIGIALGAGLSLSFLFWNKQERQNKLIWIYVILLFILVPFSMANYISGDWFFDRWKQALVDLFICVLGLFVGIKLFKVQTMSTETTVLKALAIFFIFSQAILIPGIYCILWFLNFQNAISLAKTEDFNPSWISSLSGIGGLIISILNYRLSVKKEKSSG